eukprot:RCo003296
MRFKEACPPAALPPARNEAQPTPVLPSHFAHTLPRSPDFAGTFQCTSEAEKAEERGRGREERSSAVQVVLLHGASTIAVPTGTTPCPAAAARGIGELEVPKPSCGLQGGGEHLVLANIVVGDGPPGPHHRLLEVALGNLGHGVEGLVCGDLPGLDHLVVLDLLRNAFLDRQLAGPLADRGDIGTRKPVGLLCQEHKVHIGCDRGLPQDGLENVDAGLFVRQGDVDQLVQSPRPHDRRIDDVRPVGGTDDEHALLGAHSVHLGEDLVDHAVPRAPSVATRGAPTGARNTVQLVEEQHARGGLASLVEDLPHVGLALTKPHRQQLRTLDRDEVGLALVRNRLRQQGLPAPRGSIEQHTLGRGDAKLLELPRVLHGVLDDLLQLRLHALQPSDVLPGHVGDLHDSLPQRAGAGVPHGKAEVVLSDAHAVQHLRVDGVLVQINDVELLADSLHGGLRAQRG